MLEDPSYDSVVRWGNDGDSFVVLEVFYAAEPPCKRNALAHMEPEREVYKVNPPEAFQAQQFCEFRPTTEQIRFS